MMTMKLVLGVVLVALYLFAWVMVVMLGLELRAPRRRHPMPILMDGHSHANRETTIRQTFTAEDDVDGEGARPSSLLPYYHHKPDRAYLLQLKYAVEKANEEAVRMYGPLPPGGLPVQKKTKPKAPYSDLRKNLAPEIPIVEEDDEMKLKQISAAAAISIAGTLAACDANQDAAATEAKNSYQINGVTIRTENYPRPPSSEATYYIYEKDGEVICTKLVVCDKYDNCDNEYKAGAYRAEQDNKIGRPYASTPPVVIPPEKLSKHVCLTKYTKGEH